MKRVFVILLLALVVAGESGCSQLTARGRREAAYARYVRRSSAGRREMQRKLASSPRIPATQAETGPLVNASSGPESVTSANEPQ